MINTWKDVDFAIDILKPEDLKLWVRDVLFTQEEIESEIEESFEKGRIKGRLEALPIIREEKTKLLKKIIKRYKKMGSSAGDYAMICVEEELNKLNK